MLGGRCRDTGLDLDEAEVEGRARRQLARRHPAGRTVMMRRRRKVRGDGLPEQDEGHEVPPVTRGWSAGSAVNGMSGNRGSTIRQVTKSSRTAPTARWAVLRAPNAAL